MSAMQAWAIVAGCVLLVVPGFAARVLWQRRRGSAARRARAIDAAQLHTFYGAHPQGRLRWPTDGVGGQDEGRR